jgi:hypothetical protein
MTKKKKNVKKKLYANLQKIHKMMMIAKIFRLLKIKNVLLFQKKINVKLKIYAII